MFETKIIDGTKERKEASFFRKVHDFSVIPFTKIGGLILVGIMVYFAGIHKDMATFMIMMAGMLLLVLALLIEHAKSERINLGKLIIDQSTISVKLGDKENIFQIAHLQNFSITNFSIHNPSENVDDRLPLYGSCWITFTAEKSNHHYEIAIDSHYKNKKLDDIAASLKSRYSNFSYITEPEIKETSE